MTSLRHPLLDGWGVEHGFGLRGAAAPAGVLCPRQVHGATVALVSPEGALRPAEADAIVCDEPGRVVAVVTADCVPVLLATRGGAHVAAVHAGWRGLAAGVVAHAIDLLRMRAPRGSELAAVIGPRIGPCCYEVDTPVLDALEPRFGTALEAALHPARPRHSRLDLAQLVADELRRKAVVRFAALGRACTCCDASRFDSFRRDGARAGRMVHHVATARRPALDRVQGHP